MPDDPRFGGTGPDGAADSYEAPDQEPTGRRSRRRRSMEASGGLSVSDLVQRHTGSRPNLPRPTPPDAEPPPPAQPPRRRAAQPEPPQAAPQPPVPPTSRASRSNPGTGQRLSPVVPQNDQPTGRRALREPDPIAAAASGRRAALDEVRPGESTGRRAKVEPPPPVEDDDEETTTLRPGAAARRRAAEATGRRAAVTPPGEATGRRAAVAPPGETTGRRAAPEEAAGHRTPPGEATGRRAAVTPPAEAAGRRAMVSPPPGEATGRRAAVTPPGESTGRRAAVPPPGEPNGLRTMPPAGPGPRPGESSLSNMRRPMPPGGRAPVPPPGEATGRRPVVPPPPPGAPRPGEASVRRPMPRPGEATGARPVPDRQIESSGPRPVLPPNGRPQRPSPSQDSLRTRLEPDADVEQTTIAVPEEPLVDAPADEPEAPPQPERREDIELSALTTEMEPIGEEVQRRRKVDQTLARFSAVHDEMAAEEAKRRSRQKKYMPWIDTDDDAPSEPPPAAAPEPEDDPEFDMDPAEIERAREKRRMIGLAIKVVAIAAAAIVLIVCGIAWGSVKQWTGSDIKQVDALDTSSPAIQAADKQRGADNFLLAGADTVLVAHVPADRKRVVFVSFPSSLQLSQPPCGPAKLSGALAAGGPQCVTQDVQKISGLLINHFMTMSSDGLAGIVDAIGNVELCVKQPLQDGQLGTLLSGTGPQPVDGDTAVKIVKARNVAGDPSPDLGQIQRQQRLMGAILRAAVQGQVILDPNKLNGLLSAVSKNATGDNVGVDQLASLAQSVQGVGPDQVVFTSVPTGGTPEATKSLFNAVINGTPLPSEGATASGPLVDPKSMKIQVVNGSGQGQLPTNTSNALGHLGFQVVSVNKAAEPVDHTTVRYAPGREAQARTLSAAVPGSKLVEDSSLAGAVQLVTGPEFTGDVVAPQQQQSGQQSSDVSTISGADGSCQ
ncbi:LCP family protein [Kutzneria kofuensis]|uniref:LCP family protein required for cell wall assembly n=1 Tax=Kutzneria kofuensis TaxID=103725 RepID=A0A7W9KI02_9PSEU|nr:LCP family protein [Kutzneria kofuensis]MBB5892963.1 LCP family protein required for cell wall assembly [Kutzneria kofuensis]